MSRKVVSWKKGMKRGKDKKGARKEGRKEERKLFIACVSLHWSHRGFSGKGSFSKRLDNVVLLLLVLQYLYALV